MARKLKMSACALNLRLHPHNPERYAEFLYDIYNLKKPIKLRGDRHGMISLLNRSDASNGILSGAITTFLVVNFSGNWFNKDELKMASDEQVLKIDFPDNLHPNSAQFFFQFNTGNHKLYFQTYSSGKELSGKSALCLLQELAADQEIKEKYGDVAITVVQSIDGLNNIYSLPIIKEITISIIKPNSDIFSNDFEGQVEDHLAAAQSKKLTIAYEAERGRSIVPTREIRAISEVALENGSVKVNGRDNSGGVVKRSTDEHPIQYQDKYDPDIVTENQAFRNILPRGNVEVE